MSMHVQVYAFIKHVKLKRKHENSVVKLLAFYSIFRSFTKVNYALIESIITCYMYVSLIKKSLFRLELMKVEFQKFKNFVVCTVTLISYKYFEGVNF